MRDELTTLTAWQAEGLRLALATVIDTSSSAPREIGATLGVAEDGRVVGSVSGGCVEGAVVELAEDALATGQAHRVRYGISTEEAVAVGLTCGGEIEVLIRALDPAQIDLHALAARIDDELPVALATVAEAPHGAVPAGTTLQVTPADEHGTLGNADRDVAAIDATRQALAAGRTGLVDVDTAAGTLTVMVEAFPARPRMLVFGAIDHAGAVASMGRFLGYRVTVCDARARFVTPERFPDANEVVCEWPHRLLARTEVDERTALCVLTHDAKFDVPLLLEAFQTPAGYIGAMGSRRTHADRVERLRAQGATEADLMRLRAPIGLDLGGRTPQETAVSVAAELVMCNNGGAGRPLAEIDGPIHHDGRGAPAKFRVLV